MLKNIFFFSQEQKSEHRNFCMWINASTAMEEMELPTVAIQLVLFYQIGFLQSVILYACISPTCLQTYKQFSG